jgi:hypothetical protein
MPLSLATVASGGNNNGYEPMIALKPGGMAPILSYNVPDAVSYSGKSFIALQFPDSYLQHGIGLPEGGQPSGENIQPAGAGRILRPQTPSPSACSGGIGSERSPASASCRRRSYQPLLLISA